jgi:hypothetical protein
MTAPSVLAARDAVLSAPRDSATAHPGLSSFDQLSYEPRTIMHTAYHTKEPPLPSCIQASVGNNNNNGSIAADAQHQQQLDAGDLAVALEAALDACRDGDERGHYITSKIGGKFVVRRDQEDLVVRKSSGTIKR